MSFLSGRTSLTTVQTGDIAANAITTAKMADNAVTLAKLAHGTASQNIAYDGSGVPVDVALSSGATDAEATNIMVNAFNVAIALGLSAENMVDGRTDVFTDETGVDTSASTNEVYFEVGNFYTNSSGIGLISRTLGTAIGNMASLSLAFDGTLITGTGAVKVSSNTGYVGKDFSAGGAKTVVKVRVYPSSSQGFAYLGNGNITVEILGHSSNSIGSATTLNSETFADQTTYKEFTIGTPASYAYYWARVSTGGGAECNVYCIELQFYEIGPVIDMSLISNSVTALASPSTAFIVISQEAVDAATLNTDLKAYASRDGGTTWDQITLSEVISLTTGRILTGTVTLTSSGTAMKYKIETLNTKEQKFHAVALQWS